VCVEGGWWWWWCGGEVVQVQHFASKQNNRNFGNKWSVVTKLFGLKNGENNSKRIWRQILWVKKHILRRFSCILNMFQCFWGSLHSNEAIFQQKYVRKISKKCRCQAKFRNQQIFWSKLTIKIISCLHPHHHLIRFALVHFSCWNSFGLSVYTPLCVCVCVRVCVCVCVCVCVFSVPLCCAHDCVLLSVAACLRMYACA